MIIEKKSESTMVSFECIEVGECFKDCDKYYIKTDEESGANLENGFIRYAFGDPVMKVDAKVVIK